MRMLDQQDLFISGLAGYHTYRIPALAVSTRGTLLAFCEGRKHSRSDTGEIDLLLRRSGDGGDTWTETQIVASEPGMTCGNPCPVVDPYDGTIWLPITKNLADGPEELIKQGKAPRTVWLTRSTDDGATWAEPVEITAAVKDPGWTWYATGPTHGIALASGRLLVPCDHVRAVNYTRGDPRHAHVIYSDDHGESWHIGGIAGLHTNECVAVEMADGAVYLNCRSYAGRHRRAIAWSRDGGETFGPLADDEALIEPVCQASAVRYDARTVLFSNPASEQRERLTVRASVDDCRTWSVEYLLYPGKAAYSDLAVLPEQTICCLYERGEDHPYERLTLARLRAL